MTVVNLLPLFLLQVDVRDLWVNEENSSKGAMYFGIFVAAVVVLIILVNLLNKSNSGGSSKGSGGAKLFSGFAMRRLARDIGLNHEQTKMLNFVFKTDGVSNPEESIAIPSLLDRHFRRSYRVIEQSSDGAETQHKLAVLFSTRNILENSTIGGISSTRQIKDNVIFTITAGKEKLNVHLVSSTGDFLSVEIPKNVLGSQIKIPKGNKINVLFFTKGNKALSFETRVIGYSNVHSIPVMQLYHSNSVKSLSQRRFRRRQAYIACFMFLVYVEGIGKKQRLVVDKRRLSGDITDISIGGCSIKTKVPIQVGARFKIEFAQKENKVAALGQVLRTNKSGGITVIHIKFQRIAQKSMNYINAFVYEYAQE